MRQRVFLSSGRGIGVVPGNVVSNSVKVEDRIIAEDVTVHAPDFLRVSDLRLSFARASAGLP